MKFKNLLFKLVIPVVIMIPAFAFSSCSSTSKSEITIVNPNHTLYYSRKEDSKETFNNVFNLLQRKNQCEKPNSFYNKNVDDINKIIENAISNNKEMLEKLRIYLFISIYDSLKNVTNIINKQPVHIKPEGQRLVAKEKIETFIKASNDKKDNFKDLENELLKIVNIKLKLIVNEQPNLWSWEFQFQLDKDSKLAEFVQGNDNPNPRGVFYRRDINSVENKTLEKNAVVDGVYNEEKYQELFLQAQYQASKWYWDDNTKIMKSIILQSNTNPFKTLGTNGGFSSEDAKRNLLTIDFNNYPNNNKYEPLFLFQSSETLEKFITNEWQKFMEYKKYIIVDDSSDQEVNKNNIWINLNSSYIKYDKK